MKELPLLLFPQALLLVFPYFFLADGLLSGRPNNMLICWSPTSSSSSIGRSASGFSYQATVVERVELKLHCHINTDLQHNCRKSLSFLWISPMNQHIVDGLDRGCRS